MKEIAAEIFTTGDIEKTIDEFIVGKNITAKECDFSIAAIENYVKDNATGETKLVSKEALSEYLDRDKIINEHISFHQVFKIKVFYSQTCKIKLIYSIDFGKYKTHPNIVLSPKSHIPYKLYPPKEILTLLFKEFNKIKARHSILVNFFDEEMKNKLKSFVKYLYAGKFQKRIKLALFDGIAPAVTREARLIYWYEEKNTQSTVVEVDENEVLVEYKKPKFGVNGLNAFGGEVSTKAANNCTDLNVAIDYQSITIEENSNAKLYKSKRKGFVHFENNTLSVDNMIKVTKISRNNRAIASEEENNIEVLVSQYDTNKDSVGEGVELVSETINIKGFVGAYSKLEAIHLNIDGATHQDAKQYAKFAKINRHKGVLRCHDATIKLLEGGEVHATNVNIETCLGGSIHAQNVTIGHVKNNLKIYACGIVNIRLVSGEDNIFKINYKDIPIMISKSEFIKSDIEDLQYHLEEASRHNEEEMPKIEKKIQLLREEIKSIQNSYKVAKIKIVNPLRGLNKIIFSIDDDNEIVFKTDAKEYSEFYIEEQGTKLILQPVNISLDLEK